MEDLMVVERKKKREYQRAFRPKPGTVSGTIFINEIPGPLYRRFRGRVNRQGRSMRSVVLSLITEWLDHELTGEVADSGRGSEVYEDLDGNPLHPGTGEKIESGQGDGEPGSEVPAGMGGRVHGEPGDVPAGGESVVTEMLWEEIERLRARMDRLHEEMMQGREAGDAAQS